MSVQRTEVSVLARILAVLLGLGTVLVTLPWVVGAALWMDSGAVARSRDLSAPLEAGQTLRVSATDAALQISASPDGEVHVHERQSIRSVTTSAAESRLGKFEASLLPAADGLELDIQDSYGPSLDLEHEDDISVQVPPASTLVIRSHRSALDVSDLTGEFDVQCDLGAVRLQRMTITSNSTVKTGTGAVSFAGRVTAAGHLDISTDTGAIFATLDRSSDASIQASAGRGRVRVEPGLPGAGASGTDHQALVVMGSGAGAVTLQTGTGAIDIKQA